MEYLVLLTPFEVIESNLLDFHALCKAVGLLVLGQ